MKKVLSLVLALVLVLGMIPTFAAGETGAELLFEHEFIVGDGTGNLMVEKVLTRDEMAVLFAQMYGKEVEAAAFVKPADFTDVATFGWAANFISFAQESEWVSGYPDGTYQPKNVVTGKELLSAMMQVLGYEFEWETIVADAAAVGLTVSTEGPILRGAAFETMWIGVSAININGEEMTIGEKTGKIEPPAPVVVDLALVSVKAMNLGEVEVMFNNMIDEDSIDVDNFTVGETIDAVTLQEDGKTLVIEFLVADKLTNQTEYTLEIAEIADVNGSVLEEVEVDFTANDFTAPVVEEIIVKGNKKIDVVFSEPVDPATAQILSNYKINGLLFGAMIEAEGRVVSLDLTTRLADGVHTIAVNTNVTDFAGFKVVSNNNEFAVAKDTTAPALATVVSATQVEVVIMFNEAVASFDAEALVGNLVGDPTAEADDMTWTLDFDELPLAGTEITLTDVMDFYGNETEEITFNVIPSIDLVRPEVKSVVVEDQDEIIVTFTKKIVLDASAFTLEDEDGDEVGFTAAFDLDEDNDPIETVVILTADDADGFADGDYTLEVTGLEDTTPLENKMIPYSATVVVPDLTEPEVAVVTYDPATNAANGALFVEFTEKVDAATALDKANYSFISGSTPVSLGKNHTVSLLADGKTVKIVVPKVTTLADGAEYDINRVTVMNVTDLAANEMVSVVIMDIDPAVTTIITLSDAEAVATDKIEISVNGASINPATVTASDFVVKYLDDAVEKTNYVINAVYDDEDGIITLTLNTKLTAAAQLGDGAVEVDVVARNLSDIYGNKVTALSTDVLPTGYPVTDKIAPEATKVASATFDTVATQAVIVVELTEDLDVYSEGALSGLMSNFVLEINGKLVTNDATVDAAVVAYADSTADDKAMLTFTVDYEDGAATKVGKAYSLKFYSSDAYEDLLDNNLKSFTFTGTFKTFVAE